MKGFAAFTSVVTHCFEQDLKLRPDDRKKIAARLYTWLALEAHKRPVEDLQERLVAMQREIDRLAQHIEFEVQEATIVVKASAIVDDTMRKFRRGTKWFDPHPDIVSEIVGVVFKQNK
jgi:TolA-binding protein